MNNKVKIISGALVIVVCTLIGVLRLKDNPQKEKVSVEPTQYMQEMSVDLETGHEELADEAAGIDVETDLNVMQESAKSASQGTEQDASQDVAQNEPLKVVVHVCGCVEKPGVYTLTEDDRIVDAVNKAGGFTEAAADDYLNLANPLVDGCKIYVPSKGEVEMSVPSKDTMKESVPHKDEMDAMGENRDYIELPVTFEAKQDMTAGIEDIGNVLVNINTASKEELMTLPGVGESKALKIITYREENGGFNAIEDIMNITGIKEKMFDKIKDHITV